MSLKQKTYFNWSTGKDASLALYYLKQKTGLSIDRLLTCVNAYHNRVSMHGLRRQLLEQQVESLGLDLTTVELPEKPTMAEYNHLMCSAITNLKSQEYTSCGFGDIHLEDLRAYREKQLQPYNIKSYFPLWQKNTKALIADFIALGFKAIVICIKADVLDKSFLGREIDEHFVNDLPSGVDACGENGEFHTFCYDGPIYKNPVKFNIGKSTYQSYEAPKKQHNTPTDSEIGFWFCDLIPTQ